MKILGALFTTDTIALRRWFADKTASKLLVVFLFLAVFGCIAAGLYGVGNIFFGSIATYETYGLVTAEYIIHAAIVIVLWLSLASAVSSAIGMLLLPGAELNYLFTLPVKSAIVIAWLSIKTLVANFILMSFVFLPVMLSYARSFHITSADFVLRTVMALFMLVVLTSAVAMPVAIATATRVRGHVYPFLIGGMLVFFTAMVALIKLVFPPALGTLTDLPISQFNRVFWLLPLNQVYMPTLWLARLITQGYSVPVMTVMMSILVIFFLSVRFQIDYFWTVIVEIKSISAKVRLSSSYASRFMKTGYPVLLKDVLQILREPGESGYAVFLLSIAVFFFVFLRFGSIGQVRITQWQGGLILFTYAWLVFFSTSLYLRFVFPLMSREFQNVGVLLSLPVARKRILREKALFAVASTAPLLALSLIIVSILPFMQGYRMTVLAVVAITISAISLTHVLLGILFPDFRSGNNPEKVTTSGTGIATLLISIGIAFLGGNVIHTALISGWPGGIVVIIGLVSVLGIFCAVLYRKACKTMVSYQI